LIIYHGFIDRHSGGLSVDFSRKVLFVQTRLNPQLVERTMAFPFSKFGFKLKRP
jgi:hypothetical protein